MLVVFHEQNHTRGFCLILGATGFFSKSKEVEDFWTEILGDDLLTRTRSSSIYYNHTFFSYPLNAIKSLRKLGVMESFLRIVSYIRAKLHPVKNPVSFEAWVSNHFGKRLYTIFFKTHACVRGTRMHWCLFVDVGSCVSNRGQGY